MKRFRIFVCILAALALSLACAAAEDPGEVLDAVRETVAWLYSGAAVVAEASPDLGRGFTDHKAAHAEMVCVKTEETVVALREAVRLGKLPAEAEEGRIPFSADADPLTAAAAGLSHDTGMCGGGYAISMTEGPDGTLALAVQEDGTYFMHPETVEDFSEIRTFHSLNSCMYVLVNRQAYLDAGFTDVQVDKIAAECAAHSKSSSGVRDLNSRENWEECFNRIDSIVAAWNEDHPEAPIRFDRTAFETDDALMSALATETLALRVGDVSRDSGPDAEVQTGEHAHVDRSTLNNRGGTEEAELEGAVIIFAETGDAVPDYKSRQVHSGEQNIVFNRTYAAEDGTVIHEITIEDGCSAPRCTQSSVTDHLGEFYSARDGQFTVRIVFNRFEAEDAEFFISSWEDFRTMAANDYLNVEIVLPWDEEVPQ